MHARSQVVDPYDRRGEFRDGQCYVYMVLPNATRFTTIGSFKVESDREGMRQGRFVYCPDYLDNPDAVPVDPVHLGSLCGTAKRFTMSLGVHSSLRDAMPGGIGKKIIRLTAPLKPRNIIDYFLLSPDDSAGALCFGSCPKPPSPSRIFHSMQDLVRLAILAEKIYCLNGKSLTGLSRESLRMNRFNEIMHNLIYSLCKTTPPLRNRNLVRIHDLIPFCTSLGGAYLKTTIEDEKGLCIAKFYPENRKRNSVNIEHAMLELAKNCGIRTARSRVETVEGHDILLIERFDREKVDCGYLRYRMISGFTALRSGWRDREGRTWNYALLAEELQRVSSDPMEESKELFKRMVFNALISNLNDTPGNLALIAKRTGWNLSPVYDLIPFARRNTTASEQRSLSMICGIHGRHANATNLLSDCGRFCLGKEEAVAVIDGMEERVRKSWYKVARRAGVSETECEAISSAFCYPGFRYVPEGTVLS